MDAQPATVTIQHVDDCPHLKLACDRVRQALDDMTTEVQLELIDTVQKAEAAGFRGSPTVLIDGVDAFGDTSLPVGLSCRMYSTEDGIDGAPSVAQLARAIASAVN